MVVFDIKDYWASILLAFMLFLVILLILYPYVVKMVNFRKEGMSYREIYEYMRFIFFRSSSNIPQEQEGESNREKYTTPKQVELYVFYCDQCKVTSVGYEVLCPICGLIMRQPRFSLIKVDNHEKNSCVLCHRNKCPECNLEMKGDDSCFQECPYCENFYHLHCWIKTIKEFGKCGQCLEEIPPTEFEKIIALKEQKKPNEEEIMAKYELETGKKAIWGNRITKVYLKWKECNNF